MARVELPESRLKLRKRRRRVRVGLIFVVLVVLLAAVSVGVANIPELQVSSIVVSGARTFPTSTIAAFVQERLVGNYGYAIPKRNIFLDPKTQIVRDMSAAFPALASVDMHAADFQTIAVMVVERQPRALWCGEDGPCFFIDENGIVYAEAPGFSVPVYVSYTGTTTPFSLNLGTSGSMLPMRFLGTGEFQTLSALVDAVSQKLPGEQIITVAVDAERDVRVHFIDGFMLIFALLDQGGDVFERLTLALTSEPMKSHALFDFEYLDLRFGDKLYYKLKVQP